MSNIILRRVNGGIGYWWLWYVSVCLLLSVFSGSTSMALEGAPHATNSANTSPMHVGIMCIPLYGHWKPLQSIGDAFVRRGHHVTYFAENMAWCNSAVKYYPTGGTINCIPIPSHGVFAGDDGMFFFKELSRMESTFFSFLPLMNETFRHHELHLHYYLHTTREIHSRHPFSFILSDMFTFVGGSVALALGVPSVIFFPLTTALPLGISNHLPVLGTGLPARMSRWERLQNYILRTILVVFTRSLERVNKGREMYGIPPLRNGYELGGWYDTVLMATSWGFDIPQELCPNFHPVGLLDVHTEREEVEAHSSSIKEEEDKAVSVFLNECSMGVIYINFGTLVSLQREQVDRIAQALQRVPYCIVWKIKNEEERNYLQQSHFMEEIKTRMLVRPYFSSSWKIMNHKNVILFLSHCGDASVYEALGANVPIVGIPFFADQSDVCRRVEEANVGRYVGHKNHFTSNDLLRSITWVTQNSNQMKKNMRRIVHVSKFLGGSEKAVDLIEVRHRNQLLGRNESLERCVIFNDGLEVEVYPLRGGQLDIFIVWLLVFVPVWIIAFKCMSTALSRIRKRLCRKERKSAPPVRRRWRFRALPRPTQREKND